MEIGGLGFVNTIISGEQSLSGKNGNTGGFGGVMAMIISGMKDPEAVELSNQSGNLSKKIAGLADFLKTENLLDLEDGVNLLDSLMADPQNILAKALSYYGVNQEEVELLIRKWTGVNESGTDDIPEDELLASLAAMLAGIANLPKNDLSIKLDDNDVQVIKALKLFDLMSKYADGYESKDSVPLKQSLVNLSEKFKNMLDNLSETSDKILKPAYASSQTEYLQNRFTQLASKVNLLNAEKINLSNGLDDTGSSIKTDAPAGAVAYLPQMGRVEQLTLMLNSQERPVSAEQLIKQFESILSKSQFVNTNGTQKLFIKLFPEHLGSIRVELFQKDQTMMARIITSSGTAKETLESHINGLKQAFAAQNLTVDRIEVTQQQAQQERFLNRDQGQQQRHSERQDQEKKEEKGKIDLSFEEVLLNTEV